VCVACMWISVNTRSLSFVGLAKTIHTYAYNAYTVILAGKLLYIRSYTVSIYGSGQPYKLPPAQKKEPYIYGVYTIFLAGKSPNIRSYTMSIYGFGQPCVCVLACLCMVQLTQVPAPSNFPPCKRA
jgi:hypothetical protein